MRYIRTRLLSLLIVSFTILNSWTNAQWLDVASHVSVALTDVCFSDSLNGWTIGVYSTILHTSDGGFNWVKQICPLENLTLNRIQFVNNEFGFITANKGVILKTSDGGVHWFEQILDTLMNFKDCYFIDTSVGWIAGGITRQNRTYGVIQKTSDGGLNWTQQFQTDTTLSYSEGSFTTIKFTDEKKGYAFTSAGGAQLYTTIDGGTHWYKKGLFFYEVNNMGVFGDTIWVSGRGFASTVNQGHTWLYNNILGGNVQDLVMLDGSNGFLISAWLTDKRLLSTKDGGLSWEDIWVYDGAVFLAMYINPSNNFICLVGSNGRIVINKSFLTAIDDLPALTDMSMYLFQNYPNPFNPSTTINYQIPTNSFVTLKVYDVLGDEVAVLVNEWQEPGSYNAQFTSSGKQLASGMYFYTLTAGKFTDTKKFILMK